MRYLLAPFWIFAATASMTPALASDAILIRSKAAIPFLKFDENAAPVEQSDGALLAIIEGQFDSDSETLIGNNQVLVSPEGSSQRFTMKVPLTSTKTELIFSSVGIDGAVTEEKIMIELKDFAELSKLAAQGVSGGTEKSWSASFGLGPSALAYRETGVAAYSSTLITFQASGAYFFKNRKWLVLANTWIDLIPLTSSVVGTTARNFVAQVMANTRLIQAQRWILGVQFGFQFRTMNVVPATMGFANIFCPLVGFEIGLATPQGVFALIPRYSMIFNGIRPVPSEYDLGAALRWSHKINSRKIFIEASYSVLHTLGVLSGSSIAIDSSVLKILGGLGF